MATSLLLSIPHTLRRDHTSIATELVASFCNGGFLREEGDVRAAAALADHGDVGGCRRRRAAVRAGVADDGVQRHHGPDLLPHRAAAGRIQRPLHLRPLLGGPVAGHRPEVRRPRRPLPLPPPRPVAGGRRRAARLPAHVGAQRGLPRRRRRHAEEHRHAARPSGRRRAHAAVGDPHQPADLPRRPAGRVVGVVVGARRWPRRAHRQRHQAVQPLALPLHQGVGAHGEAPRRRQEASPRPRQEAAAGGEQEGSVRRERRRDGAADGDGGAGGDGGRERGGDGGPGRRRELHDGGGRGGGGAEQPRRQHGALRDIRGGRRVRGERGGAQAQEVHHDGRRWHRTDGHHRQPERRRWLDHLQLRHIRCGGARVRGDEHDVPEHSGAVEAPGGGAPVRRRPVGVLRVQLRGVPGHPLHPLPPPVLPPVRRLRHRRLRVRQRRRRLPVLHLPLPPPTARPVQHRHGAGPIRPQPEHRHLHPGMLPPRGPGARRRRRRGGLPDDAHLPRPAVEEFLQDGGHGVVRRRARRPGRVDAVGRRLRARHAVLRRVQQLRPRRRHQPPRQLAGVPRPRQRRRRRQLHRHQHGARRQLAAPDRRPLHQRLPHFQST